MDCCEQSQMEYSALLDGESDERELREALLHGLECERCRLQFARMARLQKGIAALPSERPVQRLRMPWPDLRGLAAAAVVVFALAGGWLVKPSDGTPRQGRAVAISLGAHPERMNEARFVELTVELLQADPRYARSMHQLLERVVAPNSEFEDENTVDAAGMGPLSEAQLPRRNLYY